MKYLFFTFFYFTVESFSLVKAQQDNFEKLKEIEEKLLNNKETYIDLLKVEKEILENINTARINVKKYKKLIAKGYSERKFLEKYIYEKNKSLMNISNLRNSIKDNKSILLNNVLISRYNDSYLKRNDTILKVILEKYYYLYIQYNNNFLKIENEIRRHQVLLSKLKKSLNNIELSFKNKSSDLEGLIAETIIMEIEKQKNMLQKNKIQQKANKIKLLIEKFENNNIDSQLFSSFKFNKLQDILPIKATNIKKIYRKKINTGVRFSVINDTELVSPKNSLVVYADFFKGYGNMIILDLGNSYHLILSGLNNIKCETGDWLEKGMILGDISSGNNNDFYMEFRFKGRTISPTKWAKIN